MKISGQLVWTDYLAALRLHNRISTLMGEVVLTLSTLCLVNTVTYIFFATTFGIPAPTCSPLWYGMLSFLLVLDTFPSWYCYWFLPRSARHIFGQQKETQSPFEWEVTESGLILTNPFASANRPWSNFVKSRENGDLIMLYLSDVQFLLLPKRFCTVEQVEALRVLLGENKIPVASGLDRGTIMSGTICGLIILAFNGLIVYMSYISRMAP